LASCADLSDTDEHDLHTATNAANTLSINDSVVGTSNGQFEYVGTWNTSTGAGKYMNDDHYSSTSGAYYRVRFTGTQILVYGSVAPHHGKAAISIDGGTETIVDYYASIRTDQKLMYTSAVLPDGAHTLKVRVTGTKNASSSDYVINADRVNVTQAPPPSSDVSINDSVI